MAKKKSKKGPGVSTNGLPQSGNGFAKGGGANKLPDGRNASAGQKLNPFERMWNRRKFDVLGKKAKGEQKKVGLSRSHAVKIRKDTLLQEYRQSKKANAFIDRRFGEADESMAEEDKAIMRYQKERLSQLNKRSRFNLQDDDVSGGEEEVLTHRGRAAMDDFDEEEVLGAEDDNDAELDAEIVDKLHFGGFEPAKGGAASPDSKPKSRKEVMDELIAKSKFYKAQKAKEKEEADELLGSLDEQFKELTQQGLLASKPSKPSKKGDMAALMAKYGVAKGADGTGLRTTGADANAGVSAGVVDKEKGVKNKTDGVKDKRNGVTGKEKSVNVGKGGAVLPDGERDDYERLAREMASDLRARASDRTKDPEEAAKEERERLEKLEKKRKMRMEGLEDESEGDDSDEENGRKAQKRRKRAEASGDDLGENFVVDEEYQQEGWATDVMKKGDDEDDDEGEEEEDDDISGDEDDDVSGDEDDVSENDDDDVGGDEDENADDVSTSGSESDADLDAFLGAVQREKERRDRSAEVSKGVMGTGLKTENYWKIEGTLKAGSYSKVESQSEARQLEKGTAGQLGANNSLEGTKTTKKGKGKVTGKTGTGTGVEKNGRVNRPRGKLPYVIDAPQTLGLFRAIVDGRSDAELALAIDRIRACNSVNLAAENRRKMQVFYSVLVQYFSALAGESPLPLSRIDVLVKPLLEMSQDTPLIAAVNARERILKMQQQLSAKLREADGTSCWPSPRTLLLLRLWTLTFPPSDFRHPVTTPLAILVGEYLTRCPVASHRDAAIGAFLAAFALQIHSSAGRFCPEALNLLHALLLTALPPSNTRQTHPPFWGAVPAYLKDQVGSQQWLYHGRKPVPVSAKPVCGKPEKVKGGSENGNEHSSSVRTESTGVEALDLVSILSAGSDARDFDTQRWKESLLAAVLETVSGFAALYRSLPSFPELFRPFLRTLEALEKDGHVSEAVMGLVRRVSADVSKTATDVTATRQSVRMRTKRAEPIKQYNPRFEEDGYAPGRDYDPDRERAEKKKLKKQLKKETKGAARELRKDNYFLAEEKRRDKMVADDERQEKYRSAMAFLQQQEGAFKSGQLGGGKRKRK